MEKTRKFKISCSASLRSAAATYLGQNIHPSVNINNNKNMVSSSRRATSIPLEDSTTVSSSIFYVSVPEPPQPHPSATTSSTTTTVLNENGLSRLEQAARDALTPTDLQRLQTTNVTFPIMQRLCTRYQVDTEPGTLAGDLAELLTRRNLVSLDVLTNSYRLAHASDIDLIKTKAPEFCSVCGHTGHPAAACPSSRPIHTAADPVPTTINQLLEKITELESRINKRPLSNDDSEEQSENTSYLRRFIPTDLPRGYSVLRPVTAKLWKQITEGSFVELHTLLPNFDAVGERQKRSILKSSDGGLQIEPLKLSTAISNHTVWAQAYWPFLVANSYVDPKRVAPLAQYASDIAQRANQTNDWAPLGIADRFFRLHANTYFPLDFESWHSAVETSPFFRSFNNISRPHCQLCKAIDGHTTEECEYGIYVGYGQASTQQKGRARFRIETQGEKFTRNVDSVRPDSRYREIIEMNGKRATLCHNYNNKVCNAGNNCSRHHICMLCRSPDCRESHQGCPRRSGR